MNLFIPVVEAGISKIKEPACAVSGEGSTLLPRWLFIVSKRGLTSSSFI
jgi:hypothetical protein